MEQYAMDVELLDKPEQDENANVQEDLTERLQQFFTEYHIKGTVSKVSIGPVLSLYSFTPAPGVRVQRVKDIEDDIPFRLHLKEIRVTLQSEKGIIELEIPNNNRRTIREREIIDTEDFKEWDSNLTIAMGVDVNGTPVFEDLATIPHLLVTGDSGSGKTNWLYSTVLSILYRYSPKECQLLIFDPTMVNWNMFNGIPHLMTPVVNDPETTAEFLSWLLREMGQRYTKMNKVGVRNIETYNKQAKENGEETIPYIVCVIDEIANFMLECRGLAENLMQQVISQGRAAGVLLIVASQYQYREVVPQTIQSSIPARLMFYTMNDRIATEFLGEKGVDKLQMYGDMLYKPIGVKAVRLHSPYIPDDELDRVLDSIK